MRIPITPSRPARPDALKLDPAKSFIDIPGGAGGFPKSIPPDRCFTSVLLPLDHSEGERARYRAAVIARALDRMPRLAVDDFGDFVTRGDWRVAPNGHTLTPTHCGTFGTVSAADAALIGVYACQRQRL